MQHIVAKPGQKKGWSALRGAFHATAPRWYPVGEPGSALMFGRCVDEADGHVDLVLFGAKDDVTEHGVRGSSRERGHMAIPEGKQQAAASNDRFRQVCIH